jgi:hypothetical protein
MRVTLSYFAEPHPMAVNFDSLRDYCSHGLKFDFKDADDLRSVAIARVNSKARQGSFQIPQRRSAGHWLLGERERSRGTLRQDEWRGRGRDLAQMDGISVYPQYGWWQSFKTDLSPQDTVRFSLIVSIESTVSQIDFVTETQAELARLPTRLEVVV